MKPKDHHKVNLDVLKSVEEKGQQKVQPKTEKVLFKMPRFRNVPSVVMAPENVRNISFP
jgi:hypothetical protein